MIKLFPLIGATLKSFIRNKTSILLLIVAPLLLIGAIFLSFNPEGLQKIPVGITGSTEQFDIKQFENTFFSYLTMTEFDDVDKCIVELKKYRQYACIDILQKDRIVLKMYYDNTREPVIWEIMERIKSTVILLEKEQSKREASSFLGQFNQINTKLGTYQNDVSTAIRGIDIYLTEVDNTKRQISNSRDELSATLNDMDSDMAEAKKIRRSLGNERDDIYNEAAFSLNQVDSQTYSFGYNNSIGSSIRGETNELRSELNSYYSETNKQFSVFDSKIYNYELSSNRGRTYVGEMTQGLTNLDELKSDLRLYKQNLNVANSDLGDVKQDVVELMSLDVDSLVSPVIMESQPAYIPHYEYDQTTPASLEQQAKDIIKGTNMISLQTVYPTVLFLILLFLSLLISSFVCLGEINSSSHLRIKLVKNIFFTEILANFLSALIIVIIPMIFILLTGDLLFQLNILNHFGEVLIIVILTCSVFILMGMALAYLVRKESITLLLTTFLLVFFIFLSGVLLPLERMSFVSNFIANNFPTYLGLSMFNKVVFYDQSIFATYYSETLFVWVLVLLIMVGLIKKFRD